MRSIVISIILLGYIITIVRCEQLYEKNALDLEGLATDIEKENMYKRMERRAYTYITSGLPGIKRLPNYNFGLGKRAKYRQSFLFLFLIFINFDFGELFSKLKFFVCLSIPSIIRIANC